jgi:hypothetical protein
LHIDSSLLDRFLTDYRDALVETSHAQRLKESTSHGRGGR